MTSDWATIHSKEAAEVPIQWTPTDPLPPTAEWHGPLICKLSDRGQVNYRGHTNYKIRITAGNTGSGPREFWFVDKVEHGCQSLWRFRHVSNEFSIIVREPGTITLNISVSHLPNGEDRVVATSALSGNEVHSSQHGAHHTCRLFQFRDACKEALMVQGKATRSTVVKCLMGDKILRGNVVLIWKDGDRCGASSSQGQGQSMDESG